MIYFYSGELKMPVIYEIRNRHTDRSYIGQTTEPRNRWPGHRNSLVRGKHVNHFLQSDYSKCLDALGHDSFLEFHIIEVLPNSTQAERNIKELHWLHEYMKYGYELYNIDLECDGNYAKSKETRAKISQAHLGRHLSNQHKINISSNAKSNPNYGLKGKHHSETTRKKISEGRMGIKHWLHGKKMPPEWADKLKKTYNIRLLSPEKIIYDKIIGLTDFAKRHGLSLAGLRFLLSGKRKTHKGWRREDDAIIQPDTKKKHCSQCKEEKSLSFFNKKTESKDGKRAQCKLCQKMPYSRQRAL